MLRRQMSRAAGHEDSGSVSQQPSALAPQALETQTLRPHTIRPIRHTRTTTTNNDNKDDGDDQSDDDQQRQQRGRARTWDPIPRHALVLVVKEPLRHVTATNASSAFASTVSNP